MATTKYLETKIVTCNDTAAHWSSSSKVLLKGELAIEFPASGAPKFKIGDGSRTFANLPYAALTPTEVSEAIAASTHAHTNKEILDLITAAFTTEEKNKLSGIAEGAQVNVIETIAVNGTTQAVSNKTVDIAVPTKVSELDNDAGYISSYVDHTYAVSGTSAGAAANSAKVVLTGTDGVSSSTSTVTIKGAAGATVSADENGDITISSSTYSHPDSGVSAGTYTKVAVNVQGHVVSAENPTTLAGYGITDAASISHTHGNADITDLDASKITTGTIDIQRLPQGALERLYIAATEAARLALTTDDVQNGDVVKVTETGLMYYVKDDSKLGTEDAADAFEEFTAGAASSVPWSGVTDKPTAFNPTTHTHTKSDITDFNEADYATAAQGILADSAVQSVKIGSDETEYNVNGDVVLPAYPTTLPASDVYDWAKAATKPSYTASEVGLGNLTNDQQIKGLASGTTATHVVVFGADGYTVADSGFTIAKSVPADAQFTDTTYDAFEGASASTAGTAGLVPAPAAGDNAKFLCGDGTWQDVDVADEKVASTPDSTTKAYLVASTAASASTGTLIKDTGVYLDTTAGVLAASTFAGALNGNADTATTLATSRNFSISGGATAAAVAFNGSSAVDLVVTSLDATKLNVAAGDTLIIDGGNAEVE